MIRAIRAIVSRWVWRRRGVLLDEDRRLDRPGG
jgi:hypothetical protein